MFFHLILLIYLSGRNHARAKRKGLNPLLWGVITTVSYFAALVVGSMVVVFGFCADKINTAAMSSPDPKVRAMLTQQLEGILNANPLHLVTIELIGFGGYLLIRYVLDRKPDLKEPEEKPSEYIS